MAELEVYSQVVDQIDILELRLNKIQKMFERADNQVNFTCSINNPLNRKTRPTKRKPTITFKKKQTRLKKTCKALSRISEGVHRKSKLMLPVSF